MVGKSPIYQQHVLAEASFICKKGGIISICHNDLRDLFMSEIWKNTNIEPQLTSLTGEELNDKR